MASTIVKHKNPITDCSEASMKNLEEYSSNGRGAGTKASHVVVEREHNIRQITEVLYVGAKQCACCVFFNCCFPVFA